MIPLDHEPRPCLSVVMPAYNEAKTIIPVLDRLLPLADELIIVDDGSVDGTLGRFKKGPFLVAIDAQLPVVPVSLANSRNVMKKGQLMVRPAEVTLAGFVPVAYFASITAVFFGEARFNLPLLPLYPVIAVCILDGCLQRSPWPILRHRRRA